jgi:hypothetical protein
MKRLLIILFSVCFLLSSCVNADINNESAPFSPENYESSSVTSQTYEVVFTFTGMRMISLQIIQVAPTFHNWLDGCTNPTIRFLAREK